MFDVTHAATTQCSMIRIWWDPSTRKRIRILLISCYGYLRAILAPGGRVLARVGGVAVVRMGVAVEASRWAGETR